MTKKKTATPKKAATPKEKANIFLILNINDENYVQRDDSAKPRFFPSLDAAMEYLREETGETTYADELDFKIIECVSGYDVLGKVTLTAKKV
jgi:hypothetical protein